MRYKAIFWDWNGTLLDDIDASVGAVNDILDDYGKDHITLEQYYSYVDTPIYKFYERLFDLDVVTMAVLKPLYGKYYEDRKNSIKMAEKAVELLEKCKQNGIKQYVISAAHKDDLMRFAKRFDVCGYFEKIDAATDYDAGSKVDRARRLLESEKIAPDECVMIGDTLHDLETANSLGIDCILYSKGHTDRATLEKSCRYVCDSFEEIEKMI